MLSQVVRCAFISNLFFIFTSSSGLLDGEEMTRVKRSDIDLQTCLDNFNVHRDKIIRTQDSQNMGAKYLSEMDLGSREECLRLCCETVNCDVFVFEEKNSGSCYLFHCGPPEDFKCKFTHHVNYSSAILAVSRHTPDLENQIKLTKHEQDLSKLRKVDSGENIKVVVQSEVLKTTPSTTTVADGAKEIIPQVPNPKSKHIEEDHTDHISRRCSRFQFECRSTRECIAIYNACDGIPQCADGSDEAPELECPPPDPALMLTTSQTVQNSGIAAAPKHGQRTSNQVQQVQRYQGNESPQQKPALNPQVSAQEVLYHPQVISAEQHGIPNPPINSRPEQGDFLSPLNDPRNINSGNHYNPKQVQQYAPQNQQWMPPQISAQYIPYDQGMVDPKPNSRLQPINGGSIFNHKENGLQVPDAMGGRILDTSDRARYNKFSGAMHYLHRTALLDPGYDKGGVSESVEQRQYAKEGQRQQYSQPDNEQIRPEYRPKNYYENENYREPIQQDNWPTVDNNYNNAPPYRQDNNINQKLPPNVYYSTVVGQDINKKVNVNPKHVQDQMAHDLKHSKENMVHETIDNDKKIKIEKHIPHIHEQYPDVVSYKIADSLDLQDGMATIPRGAVLSLTLGLIITCIMAILIGCRLKVVRRRMRRGGKPYAHDADYLVNGMYL